MYFNATYTCIFVFSKFRRFEKVILDVCRQNEIYILHALIACEINVLGNNDGNRAEKKRSEYCSFWTNISRECRPPFRIRYKYGTKRGLDSIQGGCCRFVTRYRLRTRTTSRVHCYATPVCSIDVQNMSKKFRVLRKRDSWKDTVLVCRGGVEFENRKKDMHFSAYRSVKLRTYFPATRFEDNYFRTNGIG